MIGLLAICGLFDWRRASKYSRRGDLLREFAGPIDHELHTGIPGQWKQLPRNRSHFLSTRSNTALKWPPCLAPQIVLLVACCELIPCASCQATGGLATDGVLGNDLSIALDTFSNLTHLPNFWPLESNCLFNLEFCLTRLTVRWGVLVGLLGQRLGMAYIMLLFGTLSSSHSASRQEGSRFPDNKRCHGISSNLHCARRRPPLLSPFRAVDEPREPEECGSNTLLCRVQSGLSERASELSRLWKAPL